MARLRNYFLTGLVIAAPLFLTVYIVRTFISWAEGSQDADVLQFGR